MRRRLKQFLLIVPLLLMQYALPAMAITGEPQFPLKDRRTLLGDDDIAQARQNIARYPAARAVADESIKLADQWLAFDDDALRFIIAPANVPRAFDVSAIGCPNCGTQITEKFGGYAWIVDPKLPFKVKCPNCGNVYPTNDFAAYYRSGFKDKVGWDTSHVDDGWGWTDPKTGEKYWFVAYANHWTIFGKVRNAVTALGRAYVLTGDKRYAHKALVALHRFAEVYPDMDHEAQSRYGTMMRAMGRRYQGKIVNAIWETDMMTALAEAYDFCWDAIDADAELQRETGKSGRQIRAFIEANLLEDAIDAYFKSQIRGNYGMHQQTLANLAIVRQHADQDKLLDSLMDDAGSDFQLLGLKYALYNLFFRDGLPFESSVHYNSLWLERISQYAPLLEKRGRDPFSIPKLRRMYDGALAMICARGHNPAMGDSGSVWGGLTRPDLPSYQTAYRHYRDPLCGAYLSALDAVGESGFKTFDSLIHPSIESPPQLATVGPTTLPAQPSRLLAGYGMGILNNAQDSIAVALYYGLKASHGHFDRLNFELFANGQPMMPDLGYPDAMNEFVPGIFTWSKNTIAHDTLTVDAARQKNNVPGVVELFANGSFARVIDVSAAGTYPQCDQYRRAVIMVDCGPSQSYFIDIFTVSGGHQHDYSLHGPPGIFEVIGGHWSDPQPGTLAGPDVQVGQIYDDPKLGAPGYKGGYSGYEGSGFQHLSNVRRLQDGGDWIAQWAHERDATARLRIRILEQPGQQIILANARVSPMKYPQVLTYLIARREGDKLASRFVSVLEPFKGEPLIESIRALPVERGVSLEVRLANGSSDTIFYDPQDTGTVDVQRRNAAGEPAGRFAVGKPLRTGTVVAVEPQQSRIRVRPDQSEMKPEEFIGRVVHFRNELRRTAHTIIAATRDGENIVLTASDDLLVGRGRLETARDSELTTKTAMFLAPIYRGVTLANARYQPLARVINVVDGTIRLATPIDLANRPLPGQDVWLINVGPGDRFELPAMLDIRR